jgi:hypothetical protein
MGYCSSYACRVCLVVQIVVRSSAILSEVFLVFLIPLKQMPVVVPWLGYDHFISNPSVFILH